MNRLVVGVIIGLALGALVSASLTMLVLQRRTGGIFSHPLRASDFLGLWYNTGTPISRPIIGQFLISENQGTYTIQVVGITGFDYGTQVLTIDPPSAHAFCTFQSGSLDLQLQLLNTTSIQINESLQYEGTTIANVEQFTKSATWSGTTLTVSQTVTQSSTELTDQLIMEAYQWQSPTTLTVNLRNTGSSTINLAAADYYLGGVQQTTVAITNPPGGTCNSTTAVAPGTACIVTLMLAAGSYTVGVAYVLKISLQDGGVMSYSVVNGTSE